MLSRQIQYLFSNATVYEALSRNIKLSFLDMEKVYGTKKIDLQDGLMFVYLPVVHKHLFRNSRSCQGRKSIKTKWILVRYLLYINFDSRYPNFQLRCRRT
jgi:hypothetical protein